MDIKINKSFSNPSSIVQLKLFKLSKNSIDLRKKLEKEELNELNGEKFDNLSNLYIELVRGSYHYIEFSLNLVIVTPLIMI